MPEDFWQEEAEHLRGLLRGEEAAFKAGFRRGIVGHDLHTRGLIELAERAWWDYQDRSKDKKITLTFTVEEWDNAIGYAVQSCCETYEGICDGGQELEGDKERLEQLRKAQGIIDRAVEEARGG